MSGRAERPGATTEQLRDDIDHGRTGDKVPVGDPAAAPLGTDEEAAGTPIDPCVVAQVRTAESSRRPPHDPDGRGKTRTGWVAAVVVILMLGVAAGLLLWE